MITCLLSGILGNKGFSRKLAESIDRVTNTDAARIWFDAESYRAHPAPRLLRRLSAVESELVASRLLKSQSVAGTLVVNGYTLAMAARRSGCALVVATDATPALVASMHARGLAWQTLNKIQGIRFTRFAQQVEAWLPISETCKHSLTIDYAVDPGRCFVTRAPQPRIGENVARQHAGRELLFVGNDFFRKGGDVLVEVFKRNLLPECTLTVVSNDPALGSVDVSGITVVRGLTGAAEVAPYYKRAALLVLPTRFDMYPNVICEALAHGLPFVANPVGGISELIDESGAGTALATLQPEEVATTIRGALLRDDYVARSASALKYAASSLSFEHLDWAVRSALEAAESSVGSTRARLRRRAR